MMMAKTRHRCERPGALASTVGVTPLLQSSSEILSMRASIRDIVAANAFGNIVCRVQGPVSPLARLHRLRNLDERVATVSAFENHHPPVRAILPRPLEPCPMSD
jgi:hypothetical protein